MKTKKALKKLRAWKSFKEQMRIEGVSHKEFLKDVDDVWTAFDFIESIKGLDYWADIAVKIDALQKISNENLWGPAIYKTYTKIN